MLERVIPEQRNKKILDQDFLHETISGEHFAELFYPYCQDQEIAEYLKNL